MGRKLTIGQCQCPKKDALVDMVRCLFSVYGESFQHQNFVSVTITGKAVALILGTQENLKVVIKDMKCKKKWIKVNNILLDEKNETELKLFRVCCSYKDKFKYAFEEVSLKKAKQLCRKDYA